VCGIPRLTAHQVINQWKYPLDIKESRRRIGLAFLGMNKNIEIKCFQNAKPDIISFAFLLHSFGDVWQRCDR
jgi:hypothetical protein